MILIGSWWYIRRNDSTIFMIYHGVGMVTAILPSGILCHHKASWNWQKWYSITWYGQNDTSTLMTLRRCVGLVKINDGATEMIMRRCVVLAKITRWPWGGVTAQWRWWRRYRDDREAVCRLGADDDGATEMIRQRGSGVRQVWLCAYLMAALTWAPRHPLSPPPSSATPTLRPQPHPQQPPPSPPQGPSWRSQSEVYLSIYLGRGGLWKGEIGARGELKWMGEGGNGGVLQKVRWSWWAGEGVSE